MCPMPTIYLPIKAEYYITLRKAAKRQKVEDAYPIRMFPSVGRPYTLPEAVRICKALMSTRSPYLKSRQAVYEVRVWENGVGSVVPSDYYGDESGGGWVSDYQNYGENI